MTLITDMAVLATLLALVGIGCAALLHWTRDFANLLWMTALRPRLAMPVALLLFLATTFLVEILSGFPAFSSTSVMLGLLLTPMLAVRAVDMIASYRARKTGVRNEEDKIRGFVFHELRVRMREAYEAPPLQP